MDGSLVVVSGPSGSGKSSLCRRVCSQFDFASLSISTTTRPKREGEKDGEDYFFITPDEFKRLIDKGEFLEWAEVHGNYYGTSKTWVEKTLRSGKTVIFDIDVQGQAAVVRLFPRETTTVFVTTPSLTVLRERLSVRGTDSETVIIKRLQNALDEMRCIDQYDYLLINDQFDQSVKVLESIVIVSLYKRHKVSLGDFIDHWQH